jgi:hypothetical protein
MEEILGNFLRLKPPVSLAFRRVCRRLELDVPQSVLSLEINL